MLLRLVERELRMEGIETVSAVSGADALRVVDEESPAAVVLDLLLPDGDGKDLLSRLTAERPDLPVVVLTVQDAVDEVVECMRRGAVDFIHKPFDRARLVASVRNAVTQGSLRRRLAHLADALRSGEGFGALLGGSAAMQRALELLRRASESDVTVLLEGESGTGKEVAARAIHAEGPRRAGPFVAVNCGAIPEGLIESELFGHERGAFTGAVAMRLGCFESADGGTLLLDEVGDLRADLQVRLLRVLQERRIQRVGATATRAVDVRVVAATNRDLRSEVAAGRFREDLYYRLAVFPVRLPPLRDRDGDVPLLAAEFRRRFAARHRRPAAAFTPEAARALAAFPWPGNVRQLENAVERAVILEDGPAVSLASLPDEVVIGHEGAAPVIGDGTGPAPGPAADPAGAAGIVPLDDEERRIILRALSLTGWNVQEAAQRLGISRATIYRKIERYGIAPRDARP